MITTYFQRLDPRKATLCLFAGLLATWAFAGSLGLITGALSLGPAAESRLPWHSPILAGVLLALVVGLPMTVVALTATHNDPAAAQTTMAAAYLLIGWVLAQLLILREFSWLQPVCVVSAVTVAALGAPPLGHHTTLRR